MRLAWGLVAALFAGSAAAAVDLSDRSFEAITRKVQWRIVVGTTFDPTVECTGGRAPLSPVRHRSGLFVEVARWRGLQYASDCETASRDNPFLPRNRVVFVIRFRIIGGPGLGAEFDHRAPSMQALLEQLRR